MKPQPMSDAEIDSIIYASRQADEGPSELARRFAAARDAQWAAMIGEPVAGRCRWHSEPEWSDCSVDHVLAVQAAPHEWKGYEVSPLYAIKETP